MNADDICKAFCRAIALHKVPIGYALKTPYRNADGDPLTIYLRRDDTATEDHFRLEDDGQTIGFLETSGVDLDTDSRFDAMNGILKEYNAFYDSEDVLIHSLYFTPDQVPDEVVRFSALLLRLQDLLLLAPGRVARTFKDDVIAIAQRQFGDANLRLNEPLNNLLKDYLIDIIVSSPDGRFLAIYAATSETKALEALLFSRVCRDHKLSSVRSMLILETAKPRDIRTRTLSRVINSDILLASMDGEEIAIQRKMQESLSFH